MSQPILKAVAGVAALAAIAFGASAIASSSKSGTASVAGGPAGMNGVPPRGAGGAPPPGAAGRLGGPGGSGGPGFGAPVAAATAAKVRAAALVRYPGTVERVVGLPDGSYLVHVFTSSGGEVHVLVNSRFVVTGLAAGGPGSPQRRAPATGGGSTT
jgi:hypothetical protein